MHVFRLFFSLQADLASINEARIALVPKVDVPAAVIDYRPISIINLLPKIISKVLANRLKPHLPNLIDDHQTAFVHGRYIAENFLAVREVLHHVHRSASPALLLKLDFSKAFDTLDWTFLFSVMSARGFPPRFIQWVSQLLSTASSRIQVNDQLSPPFRHNRGLRQGDPISPYLFIIAADVFQQMTKKASATIPHHLTPKLHNPILTFQYADDTILLASARGDALRRLLLVIRCFSSTSGLKVNFSKSTFVPLSIPPQHLPAFEHLIGCTHQLLSITYLGMPLTIRAPRREDFMPLLRKLENRLQGWKSGFISRAGKFQLVKSVLSSIPTYFLSCFSFPKWLFARIDQIRRLFLWSRHEAHHPIHLVNWRVVCLPIKNGGLGVVNLQLQNTSLLLRWWWRLYAGDHMLWSTYATCLYAARWNISRPRILSNTGSFFWRSILRLKPLFHSCAQFRIVSGQTTSFWFDPWVGQPLALEKSKPIMRREISVFEAIDSVYTLLPAPHTLHQHEAHCKLLQFQHQQGPDKISWMLSPSGSFTVKSAYKLLSQCGKTRSLTASAWKAKVPPTVKCFFFFLLNTRLLTHDVMLRRNMSFTPGCIMCARTHPETTMHLFFKCSYATQIWSQLSVAVGYTMLCLKETPQLTYCSSSPSDKARLQHWRVFFLTATWFIWRERNARTFRNSSTPHPVLARSIQAEAALFLRYC